MTAISSSQPLSNYDPVAIVRIVDAEVSINNAKKALLKGAEKMPVKDRELFKEHIDTIAKKLFLELQQVRLTVSSSKDWNAQIESSIQKLNSSANNFLIFGKDHEANTAKIHDKLNEIDKKIAGSSIGDDDNFDVSDTAHQTKTARELMAEDPLWAHKQATIQGNMLVASFTASAVRGVAEGLSWGSDVSNLVKKVCELNPTTEKVCQQAQTLATSTPAAAIITAAVTTGCKQMLPHTTIVKAASDTSKAVTALVDQTGIPAAIKQALKTDGSALAEVYSSSYLIPKADTQQYISDASTVASALSIAVPLPIGAVKLGSAITRNTAAAKAVAVRPPINLNVAPNYSTTVLKRETGIPTATAQASKVNGNAQSGLGTAKLTTGNAKSTNNSIAASSAKEKATASEKWAAGEPGRKSYQLELQKEKSILNTLKFDEAALPAGFPRNTQHFASDYQIYQFQNSKIGANKGALKGKLLYKPMDKSALFVMSNTMSGVESSLFSSYNLSRKERLEHVLEHIRHVAYDKGFETIYITWNPESFNLATVLSHKDIVRLDKVLHGGQVGTSPMPIIKIATSEISGFGATKAAVPAVTTQTSKVGTTLSDLPKDFPRNTAVLASECETLTFHHLKIGANKGKLTGTIVYKPMGTSGLFDLSRSLPETKNAWIRSQKLSKAEHLEYLLENVRHVAYDQGFETIYLTWDPISFDLASFISSSNEIVKLDKILYAANGTRPLPVIKMPVTQLRKLVPQSDPFDQFVQSLARTATAAPAKSNIVSNTAAVAPEAIAKIASKGSAPISTPTTTAKTNTNDTAAKIASTKPVKSSQTDMVTATDKATSEKTPAATVAIVENTSTFSAATSKTTAAVTGAADRSIWDKQARGYQNYRERILAQKEELSSMLTANVHGFSKPLTVSSLQWQAHPATTFKNRNVNHKVAMVEGKPLFWIQRKNYAKQDKYGNIIHEENSIRRMGKILESIKDCAKSNNWKEVLISFDDKYLDVLGALKASDSSVSVVKIGTMTRANGFPEWPIVIVKIK